MPICLDPSGSTFVYSLYVEQISLSSQGRELNGRQAFCRWCLKGTEDRSSAFTLCAGAQKDLKKYITSISSYIINILH